MFKNYLKIAWRSLRKQPFFTFLNTFGLAVGMAGGLLICLYIYDELSFDRMFPDADRIHRINADIKFGGAAFESAETPAPMAAAIKNDFPQVEMVTRIRDRGSALVRRSNVVGNTKELGVAFADGSMFDMFGVDLIVGDKGTALKEPNTLVMTRSAAEKHFGVKDAVGQQLLLNNNNSFTVTGVVEDFPKNSLLRDHSIFMAMAGHEDAQLGEWGSHNYFTFIKLVPSATIGDVQTSLEGIMGRYLIPWVQNIFPGMTEASFAASGNYLRYNTIPLTDIHLYSNKQTELSTNSGIENVYILSFIGLFLILLASVNFMNLSTAHSLKRTKEVGVRKTLGSKKSDLIRQFLIESSLISFISLVFAIGLALLALPVFNNLADKAISIPFTSPSFWLVVLLATLSLGILAGCYPAFFMSKFKPVKVLKGSGNGSVGGGMVRNSLVVFQFCISVFLIISTLVVFQQLQYIQSKDLGFKKDQVLLIEDVHAAGNQLASFKSEVEKLGAVKSVTVSGYLPTPSYRSNSSFFQEGSQEQENALNMQNWNVDHDYLTTLDMEIIAGRNFNKKYATDSTSIILNESAVKIWGLTPESILGLRVSQDLGEEDPVFSTVIGVVKNFHFESLREGIGALSLSLGNSSGSMAVKLSAGDFGNTISQIEGIWKQVAPGQLFSYNFMEESFNNTYRSEERLGQIFVIFTILSILIACLGLFGLAAFNAEKRTKEIGIRKVLGASVGQISYKLSVDFLKLVGISIAISLPLGWFAMNKWLEDFSYRIEIGWWIFVAAALLAVVISMLTVSYQSIKAAIVNPIKSLRTE